MQQPTPPARNTPRPDASRRLFSRRTFLQATGLASLAPLAGRAPWSAGFSGGLRAQEPAAARHFVPREKGLSQQWIARLYEKGASRVYRAKELEAIGMPVGGIGAGQLYLRGDGTLAVWQIFNKHHFSGYGATNYRHYRPESPVDQGFALRWTSGAGSEATVPLSREGFPGVELVAEYPIAKLRYAREDVPIQVEVEAFSPFIPLNAKDSGLPATVFRVTLRNASKDDVIAGVAGWLENAVGIHSAAEVDGLRRSRLVAEGGRGMLQHSATAPPPRERPAPRPAMVLADFEGESYGDWKVDGEAFGPKPAAGTLERQQAVSGFQGKGLVNTFRGGDPPQGSLRSPPFRIERRHINFLIGGGSHAGKTCVNLIVDGKAVRTAAGKDNEKLEWRAWNVEGLEGREAVIEILDKSSDGWGHVNVDQIELADEPRGDALRFESQFDFGTLALACEGPLEAFRGPPPGSAEAAPLELAPDGAWTTHALAERRKGVVSTPLERLPPGGQRTATFVLAWHFPNAPQGNAYATRSQDASEVARYVLDNFSRLAGDTRLWHDTYYDSTLPHWLLDRLHMPVANLATGTCQWWANGRFWAWEGVGCCEGTCAHVWNYAHALAHLFPELERSVREMQDLGEALHPNGLVGFRGQRNGAYAADGQAGTVLKCYREHLLSADGIFLRRNWPNIRRVIEFALSQDGDDDGLIENSQHNTYDINFEGPNTFVGSLYLAALRAGEEMAREVGDAAFARRLREVFDRGSKLSSERLYNGEYFVQIVDLMRHPKYQYADGCLADQVFGQGWAHQVALGYIYPREKVESALRSIWKYDWAPDTGPQNSAYKPDRYFAVAGEPGLFTCTWPRSKHLDEGVLYRDEIWTGIEYQVAGHMVWEGMLEEALAVVKGVDERYDAAKRNPWNEVECGDHYARALASWGVFTALAGFEIDGPRGHLAFSPRITPEEFRAAFTAAEGWGTYSQRREGSRQTHKIAIRWGRLRLRSLAFGIPSGVEPKQVEVTLRGKRFDAELSRAGGQARIRLGGAVGVAAGDELEVGLGW